MRRLQIYLKHPQPKLIKQAVDVLRSGGLAIYPTDTTYGLGCDLYAKQTLDRIYALKGMDRKHPMSFLCADLSEVARYAVIDNDNYRILKQHLPGAYTFILPATREVPKIVQSNTRTVGIRISQSVVCADMLRELGHPIISTTVAKPSSSSGSYLNDPDAIKLNFERSVEIFLDGGVLDEKPSSIVDLTGDTPVIIRVGSGDLTWLRTHTAALEAQPNQQSPIDQGI